MATLIFDGTNIQQIDVSGKGGKETSCLSLFPGAVRVSNALFDYNQKTERMELKKQENLQWFDAGKYQNLSKEDREIHMVFLFHKKGAIVTVSSISLGNFLDILLSDSRYARDGWTSTVIEKLNALKQQCPALQAKAQVKMKNFFQDHRSNFSVYFEI